MALFALLLLKLLLFIESRLPLNTSSDLREGIMGVVGRSMVNEIDMDLLDVGMVSIFIVMTGHTKCRKQYSIFKT